MQQDKKRFDIYEHVTNTIIALLEKGTIPWRKPWRETGLPRNLITGHVYTGINHLLLNCLPYEEQYYLTWKQIQSSAGSVLPGEKGHFVVFRKTIEVEDKIDRTKKEKHHLLRYYHVFNVAQCKDIPLRLIQKSDIVKRIKNPIEECEWVIEDYKTCPQIMHTDARAYYSPMHDYINVPDIGLFTTSEGYYTTLFHEIIHSTGHTSRLNRKEVMERPHFGDELYSIEELVAEIGACYLNSLVGIPNETIVNSAAYIQNWLTVLQNDKKFIIQASTRAQRAVDFILNVERSIHDHDTLSAEQVRV